MSHLDMMALFPLLITGYGSAALMILVAFCRKHSVVFAFALVILAAVFASIFIALAHSPRTVSTLLRIDCFSLFFIGLVIMGAFVVTLLCYDYLQARKIPAGPFYILLILAVLGMEAIVCSVHFISLFLGVEVLSLSLYGLIGYARGNKQSLEGAIKYLILAATASAFLLFGIALIYADTGTMAFEQLHLMSPMSFFGIALVLVAFGFKLAVVPFHMWSPDVYQGAPAPVTALIATGSKGAVFALLLRLVLAMGLFESTSIFLAIVVLAIATMTIGNLLALMQTNVKRLLAYSSIAHIGYLLIPLLAGGTRGASSIAFYLVSYFATTIVAFGVITVLSSSRRTGDLENFRDYRGLASRRPILAALFALALFSLTGLPPTAGFIAKFYIFSAAADAGLWGLLIVGVLNSGVSAFYYLRVVAAMFTAPEVEQEPLPNTRPLGAIALWLSSAIIVIVGFYPAPLIRLAETVMSACR